MDLHVPPFKANDGTIIPVEQKVNLEDADAFGEYSKAVMKNETVSLIIRGNPQLQEGKLPKIGVNYDKTITMKGRFFLQFPLFGCRLLMVDCRPQLLEGFRRRRLQDSPNEQG